MEKSSFLEDEILLIRHAGELPEVAYHGSLYYLSAATDGPGLELSAADLLLLRRQVVHRYREIIRRDLNPANRDQRIYRGLARCIVNWERLTRFCARYGLPVDALRLEVQSALLDFLSRELFEVRQGGRTSCVNCSALALDAFLQEIGVDREALPKGWQGLCCQGDEPPRPERAVIPGRESGR